jgi:dTDP-4-dehydrorhamnose reductase
MRCLVLGGAGMLGHKMMQRLSACFPDTQCTVRMPRSDPLIRRIPLFTDANTVPGVDAVDLPALRATIERIRPDVVVNCVGIIKQRSDATSAVPAITINSLLPHSLAAWIAPWNGRLIHFSTDCVFAGTRGCYREDDSADATDLYGRSKYLGEVRAPNALTIRTSIIGRELSHFASLLEWFLSQNGKTVRGFGSVRYSGVTTNFLAGLVCDLLQTHPELHGLYQVASDPISKLDLLSLVRDAFCMNVEIVPSDDEVSDRTLDGSRFVARTGYVVPAWQDMIGEVASDATPYDDWR